ILPLVVDDGSKDETSQQGSSAGAVVVSHPINRGVGAAFRTGLTWALQNNCDFLVHMDSDGQLLAEEIPLVAGAGLSGETDLSNGSRFLKGNPDYLGIVKSSLLRLTARVVGQLTGYALTDISCGFRCMNRKVMERLNPRFDYDYIQETLIQAMAAGARL